MSRIALVSIGLIVGGVLTQSASAQIGGVYIDAQGMLSETAKLSEDDRLELLRREALADPVSPEISRSSSLRKVSLKRLETAVARKLDDGQSLSPEMRNLAGLYDVKYIFFDPDSGDVILAGPAESWKQAATGELVGKKSDRPILQLDDLVVALRYAFDNRTRAPFMGCSIEPTADGMQRFNAYMKSLGGRMDRSRLKSIFSGMSQSMGPQAIRLFGVSESSGFALKLVAADYRLKRIALAHDASPVPEVKSYLDLAAARYRGGPLRQHRWWFVADYDAIHHSADRRAFELEGSGLKVATAPTSVSDGDSNSSSPAAEQFAELATRHFPALAEKVLIFNELQNLVDLAVVAELVRQQDAAGSWRPSTLLNENRYRLESFGTPKQVPSLVNYRLVRNRHWLISVSGGVEIDPRRLADAETLTEASNRRLGALRENNVLPNDESRWWWD